MSLNYKITLTWDEWKTLGLLLARCREDLVRARAGLNKTSKESKIIIKRRKRIDLARSELDEIVFKSFPEKDTQTLCKVMYPHRNDRT